MIPPDNAPQSIDETLRCIDCDEQFLFSASEAAWFLAQGIDE